MSDRRSERILPIVLSILIHAAIVGALVWGWWQYRAPKPVQQVLAIEATVVHEVPPSAPAAPAPPTPAPPVPVPVDPQAEQRAAQQKAEQLQHAQEEKEAAAKAEAERKAAAEAQASAAAEAELKAQAKAKAAEQAEAEAKAKADAAAKAEADRKAQQLAQQQALQRKLDQERAQREADLRSQLQAEEHLDQARSNGALAQYQAMIAARIQHAWIRPPSAHAGISCEVRITQVPGGAVTAVQVGSCNGDAAVRQSIADAAYRASPLPAPPDPALFDRDLVVTFAPND
jgi:colicin import membrane protein